MPSKPDDEGNLHSAISAMDNLNISNPDNNSNMNVNSNSFQLEGETIQFKSTISNIQVQVEAEFTEKDRYSMKVKDHSSLNNRIIQKFVTHKFRYFKKSTSPDKGEEVEMVYEYKKTLDKLKAHLTKYHLQCPFTVIKYQNIQNPSPTNSVNLLKSFYDCTWMFDIVDLN